MIVQLQYNESHPQAFTFNIRRLDDINVQACVCDLPYRFISERELMFMFAICRRPSVCRLFIVCLSSVTFVHSTQAIAIFGNVSTPFSTLAICDPSVKILRRSSQGNPSVGGLNQRGVENVAILDLSKAISQKRCKI